MIIARKNILVLLGTLVLLLASLFWPKMSSVQGGAVSVVFLDVGQGDATLIRFENGQTMLVDCGPNSSILSALGNHLGFFERDIDYVVVTHPDLDHYGGCIDVVQRYSVGKLFLNGEEKSDAFFAEWKRVSANISTEIVLGHSVQKVASSTVEIFSPDQNLKPGIKSLDSNNRSIVLRLVTGKGRSYLFMGDAEVALESSLIERYCSGNVSCILRSDVLKVGHHGSDSSSAQAFLAKVKPSVAVISVGKNKYGHPSLRTIRHLERVGSEIRRTDKEGDVEI